jgi:hypothetical protein
MSRHYVIGIVVVGLLALGGWALAQQERPGAKGPAAEGGPFVVSPAGDTAVLLETKSGKTWVLRRSVEGDAVWLPAKRIDSHDEVIRWRRHDEELKRFLAEKAKAQK